ncbi:MAG TPA: Gfo/Idh/MocA family oxidoreductase [Armatimonadetes bacterium]|nr:Gfo/Idh/MocA family oxidoreductase [Armatimonadota bacterium]
MKPLQIGIVGCGEIAVHTAEAIAAAENAALALTADVKEELAADLGTKYGVPYTTDPAELLASEAVDAVYIATPHHLHAPLTIQAAEQGKHVMVEKPMATTVADAQRMIDVCRKNGVRLGVCFIMRYRAEIRRARELVQNGLIGKVMGVSLAALGDKPATYWHGGYSGRAQTDWRTKKETSGGGILIMNVSHNLDYIRFITGLEVTRVYAEYGTFATPVEVEDLLTATLRFNNGAVGVIEATSCARGGSRQPRSDRIYGTQGQILLGRPLLVYPEREDMGFTPGKWHEVPVEQPVGERQLFVEDFARAVAEGKPAPVSGEDGLAALAIVESAYRAGELGEVITL